MGRPEGSGYSADMRRIAVVLVLGALAFPASAQAIDVGSGTFAAPLGPIDWHWSVHLRRWAPRIYKVVSRLETNASFQDHAQTKIDDPSIPLWHGKLNFQTRQTAAPVVFDQYYPYDTQALVQHPTNFSGIVTLSDVSALQLHYVYNGMQPVSPGTTDLVLNAPIKRATLHRTRLKFWMAAVDGGDQGFTYDLETARGKVLVCRRHHGCKHYWKLIYKWPPWSKIAPLGQLTPA